MANNSKKQVQSILRRTDVNLTFHVWIEDVTSHGTEITPFNNYNDEMQQITAPRVKVDAKKSITACKAAFAILGIVLNLWVSILKTITSERGLHASFIQFVTALYMICDLWLGIKATASLTGCLGLLRYHTHSPGSRSGRGSEPSVLARNTEGHRVVWVTGRNTKGQSNHLAAVCLEQLAPDRHDASLSML